MKMKKIIYLSIGFVGLSLGAVGAIVPLLPAFPFLLMAAFGFSKSSQKLELWFKNTKLYKNNLESYVKGEGMSMKTKIKIMVTVTLLMSVGFIMMHRIIFGQIVLSIVWLFHIIYFIFGVKTIDDNQ